MTVAYTPRFFEDRLPGSRKSAGRVVPLVMDLIRPQSVIDIGCGVGTWLAEFSAHGVADIWGIDGDYVDRNLLQIPARRFLPPDLTQLLRRHRRFDLVCCLEVAEHLPADSAE